MSSPTELHSHDHVETGLSHIVRSLHCMCMLCACDVWTSVWTIGVHKLFTGERAWIYVSLSLDGCVSYLSIHNLNRKKSSITHYNHNKSSNKKYLSLFYCYMQNIVNYVGITFYFVVRFYKINVAKYCMEFCFVLLYWSWTRLNFCVFCYLQETKGVGRLFSDKLMSISK